MMGFGKGPTYYAPSTTQAQPAAASELQMTPSFQRIPAAQRASAVQMQPFLPGVTTKAAGLTDGERALLTAMRSGGAAAPSELAPADTSSGMSTAWVVGIGIVAVAGLAGLYIMTKGATSIAHEAFRKNPRRRRRRSAR